MRLEGGGDGGGAGEGPEERLKKNGAPRAHTEHTRQSQGERERRTDTEETGERESASQERDERQVREREETDHREPTLVTQPLAEGAAGRGGGGGVKEGLALAFVYVGPSEVPEYVLVAVSAARLLHSGPILLVVSQHALRRPNTKQVQQSALEAWALQEHVRLFAAGPKHFTCFSGTKVQIVTEQERVVAEELRITPHHALFSRTSPLGMTIYMCPHTNAYMCADTAICVVS